VRKYYLLHLLATTALVDLVALARSRWPIEQQYRELKDDLGLDHFEGRTYPGWTHHVVLAAVASITTESPIWISAWAIVPSGLNRASRDLEFRRDSVRRLAGIVGDLPDGRGHTIRSIFLHEMRSVVKNFHLVPLEVSLPFGPFLEAEPGLVLRAPQNLRRNVGEDRQLRLERTQP
jgi:hypothetical protein